MNISEKKFNKIYKKVKLKNKKKISICYDQEDFMNKSLVQHKKNKTVKISLFDMS